MYCILGLLMIIQGIFKSSLLHSLPKFSRKMGGKKLNIGTNIKMVRILSNAVCPICEGELME